MKIKHLFYFILLALFGWFEYATLTSTDIGLIAVGILIFGLALTYFIIFVQNNSNYQHKISKFFNKKIF